MLRAGVSELWRAFQLHHGAANSGVTESHSLLLFYAAECGLKAVWLRRNNKKTSDEFPKDMQDRGHDLALWLKELRVGARIGPAPTLRLRDNSAVHVSQAHEAWRYGVRLRPEDESGLRSWLIGVCKWIQGAMLR